MSARPKILLLDDDQEVLDIFREILLQLPSQPEVHLANSGARAIALLESESFTLLITDLKMPKMDGLQVLSIVRRKYPQLRIVVMTSVIDEQYRSRAYAMGVELFWQKPASKEETRMFQDCIESLLGQDAQGGFRGMQSKSLVDIIQLECLSRSSAVLRITHGNMEGRIWVFNGDVVDAAAPHLTGESAFKEILSWRSGNFELLPAEPEHPRTIINSYQGLLLDTAQALDEAQGQQAAGESGPPDAAVYGLAGLARFEGVEFVLSIPADAKAAPESWGLENAGPMATWSKQTLQRWRDLGEKLKAGDLTQIHGLGLQRHVALTSRDQATLCVGFRRMLSAEQVLATMKNIYAKWTS
jgi:CheY-like chemotaxis protein